MHLTLIPTLPRPEDFIAAFGCESERDEDEVQVCVFEDAAGDRAILTFGAVDRSFSLAVYHGGDETLRVADAQLGGMAIVGGTVEARLGAGASARTLTLTLRPRITVAIAPG